MKHKIEDDVKIDVNIPKQDLEDLIDKATDAGIKLIVAFTAAQIIKSIFTRTTS